jgi:hypothetical protein
MTASNGVKVDDYFDRLDAAFANLYLTKSPKPSLPGSGTDDSVDWPGEAESSAERTIPPTPQLRPGPRAPAPTEVAPPDAQAASDPAVAAPSFEPDLPAEAFAALFDAEQRQQSPPVFALSAAARSMVDEIVDRAAERTLARMHDAVARLVREEIDRIKPRQTIQEFVTRFPQDSVTADDHASERVEDHKSSRHAAWTLLRLILVGVSIVASFLYFETSGRRMAPFQDTNPAPADAAPIDGLRVAVAANRVCWISITADGRKITDRLLQAGEQQKLEAKREVVLTAGDAGALAVTVNGAEVRPLGKTGQVVTTRLNLTNFKNYLVAR